MQIKRFEAKNMSQALKLVKQELGPEAVILSARSSIYKKGLLGSFNKKGVEVTAAVDTQYRNQIKVNPKNRSAQDRRNYRSRSDADLFNQMSKSFRSPIWPQRPIKHRAPTDSMGLVFSSEKSDTRHPLHVSLTSQGLREELVTEMISELKPVIDPCRNSRIDLTGNHIADLLDKKGVSAAPLKLDKNACKIAAFIGQSGVGKTTTVAKLTAQYALEKNKRVTLFTTDDYRIAAAEQLKIYAKIIRVPLEMTFTPRDLKQALVRHKNQDLILIDTPAIGLQDESGLDCIKQIVDMIPFIEIHLILSAISKEKDLIATFERLKSIPISRLVFTKLDESVCYGNLINQLIRTQIPVSYLTNGQAVPEDIEIASLEKIADLISLESFKSNQLYEPFTESSINNHRRRIHNRESAYDFNSGHKSAIYLGRMASGIK